MSSYWHCYHVCPFYMSDEEKVIRCEQKTRLGFPNKKTTRAYMGKYCASHDWKNCTFAQALVEHYDEYYQTHKK